MRSTMLHGQDVLVAGVEVPWGAAAALVLLGSVELWLGAAFRSALPTAVCGALCYALAGWWSTLENGKRLIIGDLAVSHEYAQTPEPRASSTRMPITGTP